MTDRSRFVWIPHNGHLMLLLCHAKAKSVLALQPLVCTLKVPINAQSPIKIKGLNFGDRRVLKGLSKHRIKFCIRACVNWAALEYLSPVSPGSAMYLYTEFRFYPHLIIRCGGTRDTEFNSVLRQRLKTRLAPKLLSTI